MSGKKKIVVVAGATGHIGHFLVAELASQGYNVRALVRRTSKLEDVRTLKDDGAEVRAQIRSPMASFTQTCV